MPLIKLTLEYDGTNYCGWQIQKNGTAIQSILQDAICKMTSESVKLVGSSRTDAGVHALGQTAHFQTKSNIPCDGFLRGLNSILPYDIRVINCTEMPEEFHALRDAKGKRYRYLIQTDVILSAIARNRVWHVPHKLNVKQMREAANLFIGRHDFKAFQASGSSVKNSVRIIHEIIISKINTSTCKLTPSIKSGLIIDVSGNGFLRHMIRNIVGTLVEVGQGKLTIDEVESIMESRKRTKAGICAPACGLYLVEVKY